MMIAMTPSLNAVRRSLLITLTKRPTVLLDHLISSQQDRCRQFNSDRATSDHVAAALPKENRPRRTFLHLSYSYAPPWGPALLVTPCQLRTPATQQKR